MRRRTLIQAASAAALIGGASACAPGSGSSGGSSAAESASATKADVASLGKLTLTVWDQEARGGQKAQMDALNTAFQKKYPNVTIKRVVQSFDDLKKQVGLALSGTDVPDVCQVNNARSDMGEFVKSGQLTDLTPYAQAYGWDSRFPASVLSKIQYSTDGVTFGQGRLWGLPQTGEVVGIYYSQKLLAKLGGTVPASWKDYFALLARAKATGLQPMVLGNIEKWPALHVFGPLQASSVPVDEIVKLAMGNKGASWTSSQNLAALDRLRQWGQDKYFGDSPNGLDYDTAWANFTKGKAAFLMGGSWLGADMVKVMGDDLHFMAPPPATDGKPATTGGTGIPFAIPAKAKNVAAAAAYIDFITNDDAMKTIAANDGMPVLNTAALAPAKGVTREIFQAFDTVSTKGTLLPYLDYATPTFSDTCGNALQDLIAGRSTAQQAAAKLQADYSAFVG